MTIYRISGNGGDESFNYGTIKALEAMGVIEHFHTDHPPGSGLYIHWYRKAA